MISKTFIRQNSSLLARVTFTLPSRTWADTIHLVGDFNGWDRQSHPMPHNGHDGWSITVDLKAGRTYRFRYLIDGKDWRNDSQADGFVSEPNGNHSFVIVTDPEFKRQEDFYPSASRNPFEQRFITINEYEA